MKKIITNINQFEEPIIHGTLQLPLSIHNTHISSNITNILYKHWHQELEFLLVVEGGAKFYIGNNCYEVHEMEGIFVPPNTLHYATTLKGLSCTFYAFVFRPSFLSDNYKSSLYLNFVKPIISGKLHFTSYFRNNVSWQQECISILLSLSHYYQEPLQDYELQLKGKIYELWNFFFKHATTPSIEISITHKKTNHLDSAMNYIHNKYNEDISLKTLADCASLSESQFCRSFKAEMGLSAFSYIIRYRILKSCGLIADSNEKIATIATQVGFNNISYFNRAFMSVIGCTPSEYRMNRDTYITHYKSEEIIT